ncbi:MAG TPA: hypothetical protein VH280_06040 [Verrucomicrobiae bacterium]|jgi:hypothetical protein|nr:hypothetical protein [Verrucomicrobiae bacterium]
MKLSRKEIFTGSPAALPRRTEDGFVATVLFIGLLVIMLMLATAGGMAVFHLHNEVKVLEQQQIKRLDLSVTNSAAIPHPGISRAGEK